MLDMSLGRRQDGLSTRTSDRRPKSAKARNCGMDAPSGVPHAQLWGFERGGAAMWASATGSMASVEEVASRGRCGSEACGWVECRRLSAEKRCRCGGGASTIVAGRQPAR